MPTTRLAAILFTDIVGYTAMMQTDQAIAMATSHTKSLFAPTKQHRNASKPTAMVA